MPVIFPYALQRFTGAAFNELDRMSVSSLSQRYAQLHGLLRDLEVLREDLCDSIHLLISLETDKKKQQFLLNYKRDIYNDRKITRESIELLRSTSSEEIRLKMDNYIKVKEKYYGFLKSSVEKYSKYTFEARSILKKFSKNYLFNQGLAFSAPELFESLTRYQTSDLKHLEKSDLNIEITLLKYLTRMCAKTSPFSTFTHVSSVNLSKTGRNRSDLSNITSSIRLNSLLFVEIKDSLTKYRNFYYHAPLVLNPSIVERNGFYHYLINSKNIESFQKIRLTDVLLIIYSYLSSKTNKSIIFSDLISKLSKRIEAPADELESYVNELIRIGFVELNFGISALDSHWCEKIIIFLRPFSRRSDKIGDLVELLMLTNIEIESLKGYSGPRRRALIETLFNRFRDVLGAFQQAGLNERDELSGNNVEKNTKGTFSHIFDTNLVGKARHLFYEDTMVVADLNIDKARICSLTSDLADFVQYLMVETFSDIERLRMQAFALENFPNQQVEVLDFYEAYSREVGKPIEEYQKKVDARNLSEPQTPPNYYEVSEYSESIRRIENRFNRIIDKMDLSVENEDLDLSDEMFTEPIEDLKSGDLSTSFGAFVQFYQADSHVLGVVNILAMGFGRLFSRFLTEMDPRVYKTMLTYNKQFAPKGRLHIENNDSSSFNANIHPPLLQNEIRVPYGNNGLKKSKQIYLSEIAILVENEKNRVTLVHKDTREQIQVHDLCLQVITGRSRLFKLLHYMSNSNDLFCYYRFLGLLSERIDQKNNPPGVLTFPRITWRKHLVLQRKFWLFDFPALPTKSAVSTEFDYFVDVTTWRNKFGIPKRVFVYLLVGGANNKVSRDDYKPQFIDFENPLLILLFSKIVRKATEKLKIVEMLPSASDMMRVDEETRVCEHLVQWYS